MGVYPDRATVENGRTIAPLANRSECGLKKDGIAGDDLERFDGSVGSDDGMKFNATFTTHLHCELWIIWLYAIDKMCHLLKFADFAALGRRRLYIGRRRNGTSRISTRKAIANACGRRNSRNKIVGVSIGLAR